MGMLSIEGVFECYTLEPPTKAEGKPRAIPLGCYELVLLPSKRFNTFTPHVLKVPDFTGIEIHPGNDPEDTHGCLLVGQNKHEDWVGNSIEAFNKLKDKLTPSKQMYIRYEIDQASLDTIQ